MARRDRSLSVRFLLWWVCAVSLAISLFAWGLYAYENRIQKRRLQQETLQLAAVLAPRVLHDLQNHVASYAHRTLRSVQATDKNVAFTLYGPNGAVLFSTSPVFRRAKEIPVEVSQALADKRPRWTMVPAEDRCHVFYPLLGSQGASGVMQVSRGTQDLFLAPLLETFLFVLIVVLVAVFASGLLLVFMRRYYFRPLKELNAALESLNKPLSLSSGVLEIPPGEFHGELASVYRHIGELAKRLADAKKAMESREEIRSAVEQLQEETRYMTREIYEKKMSKVHVFGGYEILSRPMVRQQWGRLWKNVAVRTVWSGKNASNSILFSFWNANRGELRGLLQGLQWDEIFSELVGQGKNPEAISDELFMEFGLELDEWLIGQWDARDGRLEILGNAWACLWDQGQETFTFLKDAQPLPGTRKKGFAALWHLGPADKLVICNTDSWKAAGVASEEPFLSLLSKNIRSSSQNLLDMLLRELPEGKYLRPEADLLLMIHCVTQIGIHDAADIPAIPATPSESVQDATA